MDLNCDLGESFGLYRLGNDEALLSIVTSANIACGLHAGDPLVMQRTVRMAVSKGVAIGAHPGYPDLQGFGRREMNLSAEEVEAFVLYQIGALMGFVRAEGGELVHVKPHGALYNQAAKDRALARAIVQAVKRFSRQLIVVGLAGSVLVEEAREAGLPAAAEGFPDRAYNPDGTLKPRREPGAVLETVDAVCQQAIRLATRGAGDGAQRVPVDTLCIHGDGPHAVEFAAAVRDALQKAGISLQPLKP
ncbi:MULTISPECIES: LamB/YcsF family protein [Anaerolinea]|uniref:LamB/YcsF family protein n=1 Tax=Anaerolinea TaxID=233189 RepID=UPI0026288765|nr:5-oxoprolinase subunit PxpA [Anaerolinea thermophila]